MALCLLTLGYLCAWNRWFGLRTNGPIQSKVIVDSVERPDWILSFL